MATAATQVDDLKKEVEKLRKEINKKDDGHAIGRVDALTGAKYGPNSPVTTRAGKLQIDGLLQVWYQNVQNDNLSILRPGGNNNATFDPTSGTPVESGRSNDNDTFRIRRTELKFTIDIHENIAAVVMIDPAREGNIGFYPLPTFVRHDANFAQEKFLQTGRALQAGNNIVPQLLQDAYISYHGVVPHHDFTIGQFIPPTGEEASRGNAYLDFVERAMVTQVGKIRDIGAMMHGSWVDGRVQYLVGVFNGPGGTVLTDPEITEGGNRTDDNDKKDIAWRIQVRPVWSPECWYGRLELGYARTDGWRGKSGSRTDEAQWVAGENLDKTAINRQAAWIWYRPNGPVKGMWLRGEWGSGKDRIGGTATLPPTELLYLGSGNTLDPVAPVRMAPQTIWGYYGAIGYRLSDSCFASSLKGGNTCQKILHDTEFAFRFEQYGNITTENPSNPDFSQNVFNTKVWTAGINYYIKGYDARVQANYLWVDEPENKFRGLREAKNNVFVINYQVMF
ncbi:MAG TPA: porin [Planctomycetota bacterium]|jgi:hypothetical protein